MFLAEKLYLPTKRNYKNASDPANSETAATPTLRERLRFEISKHSYPLERDGKIKRRVSYESERNGCAIDRLASRRTRGRDDVTPHPPIDA